MADKTIDTMEDDIKRMAGNLRPVVAGTLGQGAPMPSTRETVTVSHIHKALDQLIAQATTQADQAYVLLAQLTGANESPTSMRDEPPPAAVFAGMARQIMNVGQQLARLQRAHEALAKVLS
jgi:hypothetical protein